MEWDFGRRSAVRRRGYLPHMEIEGATQFITFRLCDSLPQSLAREWKIELQRLPRAKRHREMSRRVEACLDAGYGSCLLRERKAAAAVETVLFHADGQRYRLHSWVIMPNHCHVLATLHREMTLDRVVGAWKRFSARAINQAFGTEGQLWELGYYDRWIRDEAHFKKVVAYIHDNPVKAEICDAAEDFRWSSARQRPSFRECMGE